MLNISKISILIIFISSCTVQTNSVNINKSSLKDTEIFTRDDFNSFQKLTGEVIHFDKALNPLAYRLLADSILLVELLDNSSVEYWAELYSFPKLEFMGSIIPKGRGPGEFLSCRFKFKMNESYFLVHDIIQSKMAIYNIDSVLEGFNNYIPEQIYINRNVNNFAKLNDTIFLGYNMYYLDDENYANNVDELILFLKNGKVLSYDQPDDLEFFTPNVSGSTILVSQFNDRVVLANTYIDQIKFFDLDLNLIHTMRGPDMIQPKYALSEATSKMSMVGFRDNKMYGAFEYADSDDDYMYLLYRGLKGIKIYSEKNGVEIDKIYEVPSALLRVSWNGDLIDYYQLDKFIFEISIDSNGKYLYGTHWKTFGEYPQLIRYQLK